MSISDDLDRNYAPGWRPNPGDKLVGTVTDRSERGGYQDKLYPIVTVRQEDGTELAFHAFHTVAHNLVDEHDPQVGDQIGVKYLGQVQGRERKFHGYKMRKAKFTHQDADLEIAKEDADIQARAADQFGDDPGF